jgi:hypothetical protein
MTRAGLPPIAAIVLVTLLSAHARAVEPPATSTTSTAAPSSDDTQMPVFKAPVGRGTPDNRIGGASRGSGAAGQARLEVIAPDQTGLTASEQPTLYWFLSAAIDKPVEVMISVGDSEKPAYDSVAAGPVAAGFHAVRLSQLGVKLSRGVDYEWTVAIILNPQARSEDLVASGHIERVEAAPPPPADPRAAVRALAAAGLWYDAFDAASTVVARQPQDGKARLARAALLRQVHLDDAAEFEEAARGKAQ